MRQDKLRTTEHVGRGGGLNPTRYTESGCHVLEVW